MANKMYVDVKIPWQHGNIIKPHLLIILGKGSAHGIFVDSLYNTYDFPITVTDGHAEDGLSLVAC